jgi:hypothetical protein
LLRFFASLGFYFLFHRTVALPTYRRVGLLCVGFCGGMCGSAVFADAFFLFFYFL